MQTLRPDFSLDLLIKFLNLYVSRKDKIILIGISIGLSLFIVFDLISVYLLALILSSFSQERISNPPSISFLSGFSSITDTVLILTTIAVFVIKTLGQLALSRTILLRFANIQIKIASQLLKRYFYHNYLTIKNLDSQRILFFANEGLHMITSGLIGGFLLLSFEILNVLLIISLLSFVNWKVTLLVFLSLSLYLLATTSLLARKMSNIGNLQVASGLESRRRMTDVILGWKEIKSFQLENVFSNLFINERGKLGKFLAIGTWNQNLSKYIFEFFLISVASCFVFVSKTTLFQESMDITYLSLLLVAMLRLVPSFMRIQGLTLEISRVTQPSYTLLNDTRSLWEPSSRVPNVRGGPVEE